MKTNPHILIYKTDDDKQIVSVGMRKVDGKWRASKNYMPASDLLGWLAYLKGEGHTIYFVPIDKARLYGIPIIAGAPGSSQAEAFEAAAAFVIELSKAIAEL
jgi:hypothetical protein